MNKRIVCIELSRTRYQDRTNVAITRKVREPDGYTHFEERNYTPGYRRLLDLEELINESDDPSATIRIDTGHHWLAVSYETGE